MSTKLLDRAATKAVATETGTIEFYALAFSKEPDLQGDRIDPHAADDWLKTFYAQGRPLPISFAHAAVKEATDPFAIVGYAPADPEHVWVDEYGLRVRATLDVDTNKIAQQVHMLAKRGSVSGASVAYFVPPGGETRQRDGSSLITKMEILEAGPCLDPANPDAYVIAVKNQTVGSDTETNVSLTVGEMTLSFKAGRTHSAATTSALRDIVERILSMIEPPTEEQTGNSDEPEANEEDPDTARIRRELAAAQQSEAA